MITRLGEHRDTKYMFCFNNWYYQIPSCWNNFQNALSVKPAREEACIIWIMNSTWNLCDGTVVICLWCVRCSTFSLFGLFGFLFFSTGRAWVKRFASFLYLHCPLPWIIAEDPVSYMGAKGNKTSVTRRMYTGKKTLNLCIKINLLKKPPRSL